MALNPLMVELVRALLAQPVSQREIARRTGISRGSVATIKQGRWRPPTPRRDNPDLVVDPPTGPPARCTKCGARVYGTCHACRVRHFMRRMRRLPDNGKLQTEPITLRLQPKDHARYEEVRAQRKRHNAD